jgi:hypothetical protein
VKIVNRTAFLAMPAETVYSKYAPCFFGPLCIKGNTIGANDFGEQQIADAIRCSGSDEFFDLLDKAEKEGASLTMDFDCQGRDGLFDAAQLFAVWEPQDVAVLIARLTLTVGDKS